MPEQVNISEFITWMEKKAKHPMHFMAIKSFKTIRKNKGEIRIEWKHFARINGFEI